MKVQRQFTDANWYIFEMRDENDNTVYVGFTKNPEQRLRQLTRVKPHPTKPNSSHGMFYNLPVTMEVIAGFDEKKDALEALEILKEESDPDYLRKKLERKEICSRAGKATITSGNHNMNEKYVCEDGHITTAVWMKRYCLSRGLDPEKSVKIG